MIYSTARSDHPLPCHSGRSGCEAERSPHWLVPSFTNGPLARAERCYPCSVEWMPPLKRVPRISPRKALQTELCPRHLSIFVLNTSVKRARSNAYKLDSHQVVRRNPLTAPRSTNTYLSTFFCHRSATRHQQCSSQSFHSTPQHFWDRSLRRPIPCSPIMREPRWVSSHSSTNDMSRSLLDLNKRSKLGTATSRGLWYVL